jgi:anti-sigma regulatory factor (Ser/Thr protein kinase)
MRCELDADLAEVGVARSLVRRNLADVPAALNADAQLIVSELVTNAVEHGNGDHVVLALRCDDDAVALTVESIGPSPNVREAMHWKVAPAGQSTGRGLGIVRSLADRIEVSRPNGRLVITASLIF